MFKRMIWVVLLLTAGCAEETEFAVSDPVHIEAAVADVESRTSMSGSTASFASGDAIGVFETLTGQSNKQYTYNGTTWSSSSPVYWRDGTSTHRLCAYYPYNSSNSGTTVSIPVLSSQTVGTTPSPAADFLVADSLSKRVPNIGLAFKHKFALLQFNVTLGILGLLNPYNLNSITIGGGNLPTSSSPYGIVNKTSGASGVGYDLIAGALSYGSNTSVNFAQSFKGTLTGLTILYTAVTIYIFILPGTYSNPVPSVIFNLSLLTGKGKDSSVVNLPDKTFQAGTKYKYDVTIYGTPLLAPQVMLAPREVVPID